MGRRLRSARGRRFAGLALPSRGGGRRFRPDFAATARAAWPNALRSGSRGAWPGPRRGCAICAAARKGVSRVSSKQRRAFGRSGLDRKPWPQPVGAFAQPNGAEPFFAGRPPCRPVRRLGAPGPKRASRRSEIRRDLFCPAFIRCDSPAPSLSPLSRLFFPFSFFCFPCLGLRSPQQKKNGLSPLFRSLVARMRRGEEASRPHPIWFESDQIARSKNRLSLPIFATFST